MRLLRRFRSARTSPYAARQARDDADIAGLLDDLLAPDSPCVDVGAHTGDFLDRFIARAPRGRHVAIEALPDLAADLARRYPDVQVEHCAVGERDAEVTFFRQPERPAWSSLAAGHRPEGTAPGEPINVPMRRLDEIVEVAAFVKIDVEGAELGVLLGAPLLLASRPVVLFEHAHIHADHFNTVAGDIWDEFERYGLDVWSLNGRGPHSRTEFAAIADNARDVSYGLEAETNFLARPREPRDN